MKTFLLIFIMVSGFALGQTENFKVANQQIEWQKIYESDKSSAELISMIKGTGKFKVSDESEASISGTFENVPADYKGAGFTTMGTNIAIINSTVQGFFSVDFKDGKYRVTLKNLNTKAISTVGQDLIIPIMEANALYSFEFLGLKKGTDDFNSTFKNKPVKIYDYTFTNLFDFSRYQNKNDNW